MLTADRVAGGGLVLLAVAVLVESRSLPLGSLRQPGPAWMPVVLALLLLGLGLAVAALGGRAPRVTALGWGDWRHAAAVLAAGAFAAVALERLGFRLTMAVVLAFLLGVVERRRPLPTLLFAAGLSLGTFLVFHTLLRVPLPRGPFGL
jgi:hypothetical protein